LKHSTENTFTSSIVSFCCYRGRCVPATDAWSILHNFSVWQ